MERISIKIDVTKINKDKIVERHFTTKDGKDVAARELKLDIVPLKEPKLIKEGETWAMWKTHFVSIAQTDDERKNKAKSVIIGNGIMFKDKKAEEQSQDVPYPVEEINPEDIPF